jgi:Zn-finger nucleic acid-binding protein
MLCATCGFEVLSSFKHAIARNECPACGGQIMDEESLAVIEDVGRTILESAAVREETAHNTT